MRTRQLRRNLALMWGIRISAGAFVLAVPTLVRYWQIHGLSLSRITLLQAVFAVTLGVGQGPTGTFADLFQRRISIMIGAALDVIGALLYLHASDFAGFMVAEITLGLGMSFVSGADRALLYETLCELDEATRFSTLWSRITAAFLWFMAGGALVGGVLATYDPRYPFIGAAIIMLVQLLCSLGLTEPARHVLKTTRITAAFFSILRHCWTHRRLRGLLLCSAIFTTCTQLGLWLYQPYFEQCRLPLIWWGAAFAIFNGVAACASGAVPSLDRHLSERQMLWGFVALQTAGYCLLGWFSPRLGFTFIFLHQIVRGLTPGTLGASITRTADDEERATVSSVESLLFTLFYSILLIPVGVSAQHLGLSPTFLGLAALSLVVGAFSVATLATPARPDP